MSDAVLLSPVGGFASLVLCWLIVAAKSLHGRFSLGSTTGVPTFREAPTRRVGRAGALGGGVAISLATLGALAGSVGDERGHFS